MERITCIMSCQCDQSPVDLAGEELVDMAVAYRFIGTVEDGM